MELAVFSTDPRGQAHDLLAIPVLQDDPAASVARALEAAPYAGAALAAVKSGDFLGKAKDLAIVYPSGDGAPRRLALVGLGKREKIDLEGVRRAVGTVVRRARAIRSSDVSFLATPEIAHAGTAYGLARAALDAALLAAYEYETYKTKEKDDADRPPAEVRRFRLHAPGLDPRAVAEAARVAAALVPAMRTARDLGNLPPNDCPPRVFADRARAVAAEVGLACDILGPERMESLGMGAFLGVACGSDEPPRLIVLDHRPPGTTVSTPPLAVIGKGITFDTGGISIKPADKMEEMKFDKCGGCATVGILEAAARLGLPQRIVGFIAASENMPSGKAQRPGDIRRAMNGTTIEIINTDAEGRLVLADTLAYAVRDYKPAAIVDMATLTGACVVALGKCAAGLFANDEALSREVVSLADATGERVWPLPTWADYEELIKSPVADIKNSGGREGGAISAALFLKRFVDTTPWVHLDIAGVAWTTEERPYHAKGATGFGVRLVTEWLRGRAGLAVA